MKKIFALALSLLSFNLCAETSTVERGPVKLQNFKDYNTVVTLDFIYWKFFSSNLLYGRDGIGITNSAPAIEVPVKKTGGSIYPHFPYNPGYRVGLGFKFGPKKAFDLVARYTWLYNTPRGSISESEITTSFLPINWLVNAELAASTYHQASLQSDLHFNFAEIQSGYTFGINRYLSLRPYVALASIVVDATLDVRYAFTTPTNVYQLAKIHGECFSWAIGPRVGIDFSFFLNRHLGLYFNSNWTHQAAQLTSTTKQTQKIPAHNTTFVIQRGKVYQTRSNSYVGLELGPTWDQWFCNERYHLQIRATWQTATLGGSNLSFLNNNNVDVPVGAEFRGLNLRALFEF